MSNIVAEAPERAVVFSHPVYQYLTRRYQLNGNSVHWEPNEMPTETMWDELRELLEEHSATWMIWEAAPREETVRRLADLGLQSVVFAPCGNQPSQGDYLSVQRENLEAMLRVLAPQ